ncbi:hypothetical protein [Catenulispora sp. MAP5-51]|uniref:hypothetical protein n=1 Tax=unclassified Catenulispora TaxID=414885 RepID=UPI003513FE02
MSTSAVRRSWPCTCSATSAVYGHGSTSGAPSSITDPGGPTLTGAASAAARIGATDPVAIDARTGSAIRDKAPTRSFSSAHTGSGPAVRASVAYPAQRSAGTRTRSLTRRRSQSTSCGSPETSNGSTTAASLLDDCSREANSGRNPPIASASRTSPIRSARSTPLWK